MDLTVLNLAVPHLSADLKPSSSQLLWIVDIYGFLLAGCLITMGKAAKTDAVPNGAASCCYTSLRALPWSLASWATSARA